MSVKINPPEGVPSEVLEAAAERAFRECARYWKEKLEDIEADFLYEMSYAWESAGGDPDDCAGFVELEQAVQACRAACQPQGKVPPFNGIRKEIG